MTEITNGMLGIVYTRNTKKYLISIEHFNSKNISPILDVSITVKNLETGVTYYKNKLNHKTVWYGTLYNNPTGLSWGYEGIKIEYEQKNNTFPRF